MIVKAIYEPNFGDKTTGSTYENQIKRRKGDIFECDNKLAKERIKKGFVVEATEEEKEAYKKQQEELLNAQVVAKDLEKEKIEEDSDKKSHSTVEVNYDELTDEELIELANSKAIRVDAENFVREEIIECLKKPLTPDDSTDGE